MTSSTHMQEPASSSLLWKLIKCRPEELPLASLLFAFQFSVLFSYLIVKSARLPLLLNNLGSGWLLKTYFITPIFTLVAVIIYQYAAGRFQRRAFVTGVTLFTSLAIIFFWWGLRGGNPYWSAAFFIWCDIYSVGLVTLAWSLAQDLLTPDQGKRLLAPIGIGAMVGGIMASLFAQKFVIFIGTENLLLVSAVALLPCIGVVFMVSPRSISSPVSPSLPGKPSGIETKEIVTEQKKPKEDVRKGLYSLFDGFIMICKSGHLAGILALLGIMLMVSLIIEVQFAKALEQGVAGKDQKTVIMGQILFLSNSINLFIGLFITSRIVKSFGLRFALLIHPVCTLVTLTLGYMSPTLNVMKWVKLTDWSLKYGINQASKEMLYLPTTRNEKYKAKAFIDIFFYRFMKVVVAGVMLLGTEKLGFGIKEFMVLGAVFTCIWLVVANKVSMGYKKEVLKRISQMLAEIPAPPVHEEKSVVHVSTKDIRESIAHCYRAFGASGSSTNLPALKIIPDEIQRLFGQIAVHYRSKELTGCPILLSRENSQERALAMEYVDITLAGNIRGLVLPLLSPGLASGTALNTAKTLESGEIVLN